MELTPQELDDFSQRVVAFITRHLETLPDKPAMPPGLEPEALRASINEPLPRVSQGIDKAFDDFINKVAQNSAGVGHPLFLGWTRTSPLGAAILSETLGAALNQSVAVWDGAPAATEVELLVIEWIKEMSGYAPGAAGILASGGSMASFICLVAARSAVLPEVREQGLYGMPPLTLYVTPETHYCIPKAAEMMGLGRRSVKTIPVDSELRMDPTALAEQIRLDLEAGFLPLAVAATMGTVNSGACDDLDALHEVCRRYRIWLHVDGAYGGLANLVPKKRHFARGLEKADSFVFDPHKGMYMPFEAGCALVKDPKYLREAFAVVSDYLPNTGNENGDNTLPSGGRFHFRDYGPQLSRSFRALKIYLSLKIYGADRLEDSISRQYALAAELGRRIEQAEDFQLLAPVTLGVVAFCYTGGQARQLKDDELDELNAGIQRRLQEEGHVFLSGTRIRGRYALRACFASFRTEEGDLERLIEEVRDVGKLVWI
jgi:aromatic-L-amino-acid/L-tryptophan decarboxylase